MNYTACNMKFSKYFTKYFMKYFTSKISWNFIISLPPQPHWVLNFSCFRLLRSIVRRRCRTTAAQDVASIEPGDRSDCPRGREHLAVSWSLWSDSQQPTSAIYSIPKCCVKKLLWVGCCKNRPYSLLRNWSQSAATGVSVFHFTFILLLFTWGKVLL